MQPISQRYWSGLGAIIPAGHAEKRQSTPCRAYAVCRAGMAASANMEASKSLSFMLLCTQLCTALLLPTSLTQVKEGQHAVQAPRGQGMQLEELREALICFKVEHSAARRASLVIPRSAA